MRRLQRPLILGVLAVVARPRLTLVISGVVLAICAAAAWLWLPISTDQNKLFSSNVPFFRAFLDFEEKFPENDALYVIIELKNSAHPPPLNRWIGAADAITARLRTMPAVVQAVDSRVPLDQLGQQSLLFEDQAHLPERINEIARFIPLVQLWAEQARGEFGPPIQRFLRGLNFRFAVPIASLRPGKEEAVFVKELADSWNRALANPHAPITPGAGLPDLTALGVDNPRGLGYYYVPDDSDPSRHLLLVRIYPKENFTALTAITEIVDSVRGAVADEAKRFPEFQIGLTGRPALDADEMRISDQDSNRSEIVALMAVFVGLVVMFRSVWLAIAAEMCLGVGIGWTFGWATIYPRELNLLSIVFLIALIGIGMDYLVQILMRYRQESARRSDPARIWTAVFTHIAAPINTACLGASGAFLVALFTHFKGAADLGVIAGGGLLLCLLSGYTVLPALLVLFPAKPRPKAVLRATLPPPKPQPTRLRRWLFLPVLWITALIVMIPFMLRYNFDPGLLNLQAPNLESVKLIRKLQTWSAVVLSKDLDQLRQVRQAMRESPQVGSTESILDAYANAEWLAAHAGALPSIQWAAPAPVRPTDIGPVAGAARTLAGHFDTAGEGATAQSLRDFAARLETMNRSPQSRAMAADRLSAWQIGFVAQLHEIINQFHPGPVDIQRLPAELRNHLISADGTYALYLYPKADLWNRGNLSRFVRDVEHRVSMVPGAPAPTGIAINIYHSTNAIEKAFHKATLYALGLIVLLVWLDLRRVGQTLMAISVLALGLPMLVGLMGLLDVSWNFANFFGLPILIGAGHEYGVFMVHRYREGLRDPRRVWRGWDTSDKALLLCAFITSSSFGFFWALGHHEGLRSLGLVMALGIACIYVATIAVLRPLLRYRLARKLETMQSPH